ncbi:unnamed protein product [Heligmosomoides polygyrus]|uniref:CUB domain-containing protein n=1 Tax=Heligmosomoides polygyrus TaxID=6339 RepID=A0A183GWR1_HELPZ|nr:unnamed protein product [Heligmosomoides polygyrus]
MSKWWFLASSQLYRCLCPGGRLCDERVSHCEFKPPGCGQELFANATAQAFRVAVGDESFGEVPGEDFKKCHYWRKAPKGSKIEVKILEFGPEGVAADGCIYGGVEIKTQSNQRTTGYRFCSKGDVNTTLRSFSNTVPIIAFSRENSTSVLIQYRQV